MEKAELLQKQYVKVFSNPEHADMGKAVRGIKNQTLEALEDATFTPADIVDAIKELHPYSATPDGDIPASVLVICIESLSYPLYLLWRESIDTGQIPNCLNIST